MAAEPKRGSVLLAAFAGLLLGPLGGLIVGLVFSAFYTPHDAGDFGDWTAVGVAIYAIIIGAVLGPFIGAFWQFAVNERRKRTPT